MVSMIKKVKDFCKKAYRVVKPYFGLYSLFEIISLVVIAAGFGLGFLPAEFNVPKFGKSTDPLSIIISLLPLVFTILSLMLGTPSDRIAGLKRPTFLRLVPKSWPVGRRLLPFFIGFYVCLITVYSVAPAYPKLFNPFIYNIAASSAAIAFVGITSFVNLSILLKTNGTIFRILGAHVQEIVHEAEPLSSNLSDVKVAVESMAETVGISATHKALLKKFRKVNRNPRVKPEINLLNSILEIEICMARRHLEGAELSSEARVEALAFAKAGIDNIEMLVKKDEHSNFSNILADAGDVSDLVRKLAMLVSLLHRLSVALKLQKDSKKLFTILYFAGCNKSGKTYMDFDQVQFAALAVEIHLFTDGLYENEEFDNWLWKFLRDEIDYPLTAWEDSPIYFFLVVYLLYAKDDKNLPQRAQECISSFLKEEILGPNGEKTNFIGRYAFAFIYRSISQEKCLGLLNIIFGTFELLGISITFQYFPKNVSIIDDYPSLDLDTALDCWMELFSSMKVTDKEKVRSGILKIIESDKTGCRTKAFMDSLENSFERRGKETSKRPFSKFVNGAIVPNYESAGSIAEIVEGLFKKFSPKDCEAANPAEDTAIAAFTNDVEDVAKKLVGKIKNAFEPIYVEKNDPEKDSNAPYAGFLRIFPVETFKDQFSEEYFFEPAADQVIFRIYLKASQELDPCFEGKDKSLDEIQSSLKGMTNREYSICSYLSWRQDLRKTIGEAMPNLKEVSELRIYATKKDRVNRVVLFNKGDIQVSAWVDHKYTNVRRPSDDEVLCYLKSMYSMKDDRFYMPGSFGESRYVWVTPDDAVMRWKNKLVACQIAIRYEVSAKKENCYFIEAPYELK